MKKKNQTIRGKRYTQMKMRYAEKRLSHKWKSRRKQKREESLLRSIRLHQQKVKPYIIHTAPENFSLIENTNEVLKYFSEAENLFYYGENLRLDISKVKNLTPATIALLVASVNTKSFTHKSNLQGNAPEDEELKDLFTNSGFYDFVTSRLTRKKKNGNLLHRERDKMVVETVARDAMLVGVKNTFGTSETFDPLYDIMIECMSNTGGHANPKQKNTCDWWLYVYNDPKTSVTSYCFIDLGVGIFESAEVKGYVRQFIKNNIYKNIDIVDKLLAGKLESRMTIDKDIRGKGIPEIVGYSKMPEFKEFYIITNNVKIDLKTEEKEELSYELKGTFLYWELQNNHGN